MARNYLRKVPTCAEELPEALFEALMHARGGKGRTRDERKIERYFRENIQILAEDILSRRYRPGRSKAFVTHTPVDREIFAASFRDRVVHHFIYGIVAPWWDKQFIKDSYSCREGKGSLYGAKRMQGFMRSASENGTKAAYYLKGDVYGYFTSLPREKLYEAAIDGLKQQFPEGGWLYDTLEFLWKVIIFDDPVKGAIKVGKKSDWDKLPKRKSLFYQLPGIGIVIGNVTSQLLSNIYLHAFDLYVTKELGHARYGRYVDDFFIIVPEEEFEQTKKHFRHEIPEKLKSMGLTLHPDKIQIQPVRNGAEFLGWKVRPWRLLPGKRTVKNFYKAMDEVAEGRRSIDTVVSYLGMMKHGKSKKLIKKKFDDLGWEYRS